MGTALPVSTSNSQPLSVSSLSRLASPWGYRNNIAEGRVAWDFACIEEERGDSELFVLFRMTR